MRYSLHIYITLTRWNGYIYFSVRSSRNRIILRMSTNSHKDIYYTVFVLATHRIIEQTIIQHPIAIQYLLIKPSFLGYRLDSSSDPARNIHPFYPWLHTCIHLSPGYTGVYLQVDPRWQFWETGNFLIAKFQHTNFDVSLIKDPTFCDGADIFDLQCCPKPAYT